LSGCPEGGTVIDPFSGSGTTGICAIMNNRKYVGIELNKKYVDLSNERFEKTFFRKEKIIQQDRLDCFERFDFGEHLND
jgi:DNA modification methylase